MRSHWQSYSESGLDAQGIYSISDKTHTDIKIPSTFISLSKGKLSLAKILLSSAIYEALWKSCAHAIHLAFTIEYKAIPLNFKGVGDIKHTAKNVLEHARLLHAELDEIPKLNPKGILVTDTNSYQDSTWSISITIHESLDYLTLSAGNALQPMCIELITQAFDIDHCLTEESLSKLRPIVKSGMEFSDRSFTTYNQLITDAWNLVFDHPVNLDASYFTNGGDSIQAIRFLSKIKSFGYDGDFGELLTIPSMNAWGIKENKRKAAPASEHETRYPLSIMQEKIWNQRNDSSSGVYHEQFLFELSTHPPVDKMAEAFKNLWWAYPQLRIGISNQQGQWIQEVNSWEPDFRALGEVDEINQILNDDLQEGFPAQLMRCQFFTCKETSYFLWSHHHVLLDGWSVGLLIQAFIKLVDTAELLNTQPNYQFLIHQEEQQLLTRSNQFSWDDFFRTHEAQHFNGSNSDYVQFSEYSHTHEFSTLDSFCALEGFTPQQLFLSAISIANFSLTGKHKSYIHGISSGRSILPEHAEHAIGLLIKNIHLGWAWEPTDTLRTIVTKVVEGQTFGLSMEHMPPNGMHHGLEIPDLLFVYENYPYDKVVGEQLAGTLIHNQERTGYPLTLLVMPNGNLIQFKVIYNEHRFSQTLVKYLISQIKETMTLFLSDLDQPLINQTRALKAEASDHFPHWTKEVDRQLADGVIHTTHGVSKESIHAQTTLQVVHQVNEALSPYEKGSRIALMGAQSAYTPSLVYAIMRSGYSYVPINPSWPADRIEQVLDIASCQALIYLESFESKSPNIPCLSLDEILTSSENKQLTELSQQQEAYVLFTSGSTGNPKGVSLSHKNLSAFFHACHVHVNASNFNHIFSLTNLGFDLSLFENLYGFYIGKPIVVVPSLSDLETAISNFPSGLLNTVPSVLSRLQVHEIKQLAAVHSAGEPFSESLWMHLKTANSAVTIKNWYGPTETTTYSSIIDLTNEFIPAIGVALAHEEIRVCNALLQEVPDEIEGELIIGGEGVARGYLNASGGFYTQHGKQYYRTGDFGSKRNRLLYLKGRTDRQVKRLGQRFELGEVEAGILKTFIQVSRVRYVVANHRFILFIEHPDTNSSITAFKEFLLQKFPAYMRPDHIQLLAQFPENSNGKIDDKKLIQLVETSRDSEEHRADQSTELLKKLKEIQLFESLNGAYGFIEQGGDSILGLRMIGKLNAWGYEAQLNELLNANTLTEFFQGIETANKVEVRSDGLALTPIQHWFTSAYPGNKNHFNQSILLEIHIPVSPEELGSVVAATFSAFPLLSQVYGETWSGGKNPTVVIEHVESTEEVTACCQVIQSSFDLTNGPIAGAAIMTVAEKTLLFIAMHHFYCDGFSWRILLDELKNRMQGNGMTYGGTEVFAQVQQVLKNKVESETSPLRSLLNPFKDWQPSSYRESVYVSFDWEKEQTDLFMRQWETNLHVNEKFLFFVLGAWIREGLPIATPILETHGRSYEGIPSLAESLGWFTQFYPIDIEPEIPMDELLTHVRDAHEEAIAYQLTYMGSAGYAQPCYPLLLNFLGSFDENWGGIASPSMISQGEMVDPGNTMLAQVEINAMIVEGKLRWMMRSHPSFNLTSYMNAFQLFASTQLNAASSISAHVDDSIDLEDRNAIEDLLNGL